MDAANPSDRVKQASTDTYTGYEQMRFVRRTAEKFAAVDRARNVVGSPGAETYQVTIGSAGIAVNNGAGVNSAGGSVASWVEHAPASGNAHPSSPVSQMNPPPQTATGQPVDLWLKVGYQFQADKAWVYFTTDGTSYPEGSNGIGKGTTRVVEAAFSFNGANDGTATPDWWKATLPAMPAGTVLRYKIGVRRTNAASPVFPFSSGNIDLAERMETVFEIPGFNATTAVHRIHNDYGPVATGLTEGFHVLRSRAFAGRNDGASIYKTHTRVFYYDTLRPTGGVVYPRESDQIGGSSYGAVVVTDASVTEVWYYIDDLDPSNDSAAAGNGIGNWVKATAVGVPTNLGTSGFTKEWRFTYSGIPSSGAANLVVRLKEASSATAMNLTDAAGHYTTLTRQVATGSPVNFNIGYPSVAGETVDDMYVMKVFFRKELIPAGMTDAAFLDEFSIFISSTTSGEPDGPVLQPRAAYLLARDVSSTEHAVFYTFPNLYNGQPDFLHTVRAEHKRGSFTLGDTELVKMRVNDNIDADGDGLPNWWELLYGIESNNPAGRHGAAGDFDLDGITNMEEYLFGLNPAVPDTAGVPKVALHKHAQTAGAWTLSFATIPDRVYQWQVSEALAPGQWLNLGNSVSTAGATSQGVTQRNDAEVKQKRFYRMAVSPPR